MTDAPHVDTTTGVVRGVRRIAGGHEYATFRGIPYAQAPVGALRFAAPVRPASWSGVRDASDYGPTPKIDRGGGMTLIPEPAIAGDDTLTVNVSTPDTSASLPVLFWIHGGAFTEGSAASPWYDGRSFARDGVVTVTFGYRLGFEGFGVVPGMPGNRAVRDWILALEWVRDNIASFGGDPARVTIAGQSAGGAAVLELLALPEAQALFRSAFASSPARLDLPEERAEHTAARIARLADVAATADGFGSIPRRRLVELEATVASHGLGVAHDMLGGGYFGPVVDGELLRRTAIDGIAAGIGADKPLVIGSNDDEFTSLAASIPSAFSVLPPSIPLGLLGVPRKSRRRYLEANPHARGQTALALGRFVTDRVFRSTVLGAALARGAAPTWVYRFAWGSPAHRLEGRATALHCLDVPFLFDVLDDPDVPALAGDAPPSSIADDLHGAALRLIASGTAPWPAWDGRRIAHVFDVPPHEEPDSYRSVGALVEGGTRPV